MADAFDVVCRFDEAIDPEGMDADAYSRFRETGDVSLLRYLEGQRPTVFHCRRLKGSEVRDLPGRDLDPVRLWAAFARGLTGVTNQRREDGKNEDGTPRIVQQNWTHPSPGKTLTTDQIDKAPFEIAEVEDVGAALLGRSLLGKGRPAAWPQPATCRAAIEALVSRRVERKARSERASRLSKAALEAQPVPPSASGGATCTDATATGSSETRSTPGAPMTGASAGS